MLTHSNSHGLVITATDFICSNLGPITGIEALHLLLGQLILLVLHVQGNAGVDSAKIFVVLFDLLAQDLTAMLDQVLEVRFDLAVEMHLGRDHSLEEAEVVLVERWQGRRVHDQPIEANSLGGGLTRIQIAMLRSAGVSRGVECMPFV